MFGYPLAVFGGLPLYLYAKREGWDDVYFYILGGGFLGLLPILLFPPLYYICPLMGASSGFIFWIIVRPDLHSRKYS
jgi:hypothetical protein